MVESILEMKYPSEDSGFETFVVHSACPSGDQADDLIVEASTVCCAKTPGTGAPMYFVYFFVHGYYHTLKPGGYFLGEGAEHVLGMVRGFSRDQAGVRWDHRKMDPYMHQCFRVVVYGQTRKTLRTVAEAVTDKLVEMVNEEVRRRAEYGVTAVECLPGSVYDPIDDGDVQGQDQDDAQAQDAAHDPVQPAADAAPAKPTPTPMPAVVVSTKSSTTTTTTATSTLHESCLSLLGRDGFNPQSKYEMEFLSFYDTKLRSLVNESAATPLHNASQTQIKYVRDMIAVLDELEMDDSKREEVAEMVRETLRRTEALLNRAFITYARAASTSASAEAEFVVVRSSKNKNKSKGSGNGNGKSAAPPSPTTSSTTSASKSRRRRNAKKSGPGGATVVAAQA